MGMSVPLILITGWTLLHVQEFYVSLLTRINTQAREVSEGEKALTRSISDGLTATIPFFILPRLWCTTCVEAAGVGNVLFSINICARCSARHRGDAKMIETQS